MRRALEPRTLGRVLAPLAELRVTHDDLVSNVHWPRVEAVPGQRGKQPRRRLAGHRRTVSIGHRAPTQWLFPLQVFIAIRGTLPTVRNWLSRMRIAKQHRAAAMVFCSRRESGGRVDREALSLRSPTDPDVRNSCTIWGADNAGNLPVLFGVAGPETGPTLFGHEAGNGGRRSWKPASPRAGPRRAHQGITGGE